VIVRTILRMIWVAVAFLIAISSALIVLFLLGAAWLGEGLRAADPHDPLLGPAAEVFGFVMFAGAVAPALTGLPALVAVAVGEVLRLRAWFYYVLAGGAAVAAIPLLATPKTADLAPLPGADYMLIFAVAGFAGGFVYWLLAGQNA
jgi:hypothetical protein